MNRTGFLVFVGTTFFASIAVTAGSGCSSNGGTGASGGSSSSSTTSSTTSSSTTTSSTSSGTTTTTTAPTLDCTSYCAELMTNCTGTNEQYTSMAICMGVCAGFTAPGTLGQMSMDTLGCRIYHAGAAAGSAANATTHCPHAGPTGGDKDPKGSAGICGEPCTAFCSIAAKSCTGTMFPFTSAADCMTQCQGFTADTASYNDTDISKNDMGCRFYHLSAASASATAAMTHCPHIVKTSAVCTM